jgi:hypothetical protein
MALDGDLSLSETVMVRTDSREASALLRTSLADLELMQGHARP